MINLPKIFGCMVFGDEAMRQRLPAETYAALKRTTGAGRSLDPAVADVVAAAMRDWACEQGATHYTHWFQPMTGITAEKHDSFLSPASDGAGRVIMEFSGKELVKGESDASSFPSGGLRATFEARGYTAWDPNSYAFIKDNTLCIPTAFCSYGGHALDKKTPLLRSMEALNRQVLRILRLFGHEDVTMTRASVGAEQEYFLVDRAAYLQRRDLLYTGRTLFGAKPPKGQELDDHYFGNIKPRVLAFMKELDIELWKLGIMAKTEHNEAAPGQHELAPFHTTINLATDDNQLTMEMMKKVAGRHGLVCLLHEKPFAGVNGSGKHINWSIATDGGVNLFEPGETPHENAQFLLFLCAVVKAVDDYQDLLRISAATAGNDHRLGGAEAPPAVVSLYLGEELTEILDSLEYDNSYTGRERAVMKIGVHTLPRFPRDTTDRNRTSPFAFTGNKFEFRMAGAPISIAEPCIVLNAAVAEVLRRFADMLETAGNFEEALPALIKSTVRAHKRIIFNGNGYDGGWPAEAARRGLLNLPTTPEALTQFTADKNIRMFTAQKVLSEAEIRARKEILLDGYNKTVTIEALTMLEMAQRQILPAAITYLKELSETAAAKKAVLPNVNCFVEETLVEKLSFLTTGAYKRIQDLEKTAGGAKAYTGIPEQAEYIRKNILPAMAELRAVADELEANTARKYWPMPTYGDLLFSVY